MDPITIFCVALVVAIAGTIVAFIVYNYCKSNNEKFKINIFISLCGDAIANVIKDVVNIIELNELDYCTEEEYTEAVVEMTLKKILENCQELGIDKKYLDLIPSEKLTDIITDLFIDATVSGEIYSETTEVEDTNTVEDESSDKTE